MRRVNRAGRAAADCDRGSPGLTTAVSVSVQSEDSLLVVVPPEPGTATSVAPDTVVAGLPLLRRIVLAGSRAGFSRVLVQSGHDDAERLLAGTTARVLSGAPPPDSRRRIVILPANVVPQAKWLRALREAESSPSASTPTDSSPRSSTPTTRRSCSRPRRNAETSAS